MSAQFAKDRVSFFVPSNLSVAAPGSYTAAPPRARGLRAVARWVGDFLERRAVVEELSSLSDHELADIGLTRGDIPNVFDPAFAAARTLSTAHA